MDQMGHMDKWLGGYGALVWIFIGLLIGFIFRAWLGKISKSSSESAAKALLESAQLEADRKMKESHVQAKEEIYKARGEFEKEIQNRRQEVLGLEKRILQREESMEKRAENLDRRESESGNREKLLQEKMNFIQGREKELQSLIENERFQLQRVSGLSRDEARKLLMVKIDSEVQEEAAYKIRASEGRIKEEIKKKAQWLVAEAMQKVVVDHVEDLALTVVALPGDEMKGKIIGRDGRNIRTLEQATGVDIIIDDTPETVVVSAFDRVRREIARLSLEELIKDGRIHPARIEEVVAKVKKEIDENIQKEGEQAVYQMGLTAVHPEIQKLVGRLKFRTSYGQNVLEHSKEVGWLMAVMASEMGLDVALAKRIGLLHDIGKALSHEQEGSHASIGADTAKKYNETSEVVSGILGHHEEFGEQSLWGVLCQVADAISAARPGARSDTAENYVQRLEKLEEIAGSFKGVERTFAIQAGREIRVLVDPAEIDDAKALLLSKDIAKKIQSELQYPGQIKVTVIRESRVVEYAR